MSGTKPRLTVPRTLKSVLLGAALASGAACGGNGQGTSDAAGSPDAPPPIDGSSVDAPVPDALVADSGPDAFRADAFPPTWYCLPAGIDAGPPGTVDATPCPIGPYSPDPPDETICHEGCRIVA